MFRSRNRENNYKPRKDDSSSEDDREYRDHSDDRDEHSDDYRYSDEDSLSPPLTTRKENDTEDIELNRIYLQNVRVPSNVLLIGPKHSGKTTVLKHILLNIMDFVSTKSCIVTTDTRDYDDLGITRNDDVWDVLSPYDVDDSLRDYSVRVIEDYHDTDVFDLYRDRRSLNIIAVDKYTHLPSNIRQSIDYVILLGNIRELREVWFDLAGLVEHYSDFKLIYDESTTGYDFLVIDNFGSSRKLQDHLKWGRISIKDLKRVKYPDNLRREDEQKDRTRRRKGTPYRRDSVVRKDEKQREESSTYEKLYNHRDQRDEPKRESNEKEVESRKSEPRVDVTPPQPPLQQLVDITDDIQQSLVINKPETKVEEVIIKNETLSEFAPEDVIRRVSVRNALVEPIHAEPRTIEKPDNEASKEEHENLQDLETRDEQGDEREDREDRDDIDAHKEDLKNQNDDREDREDISQTPTPEGGEDDEECTIL